MNIHQQCHKSFINHLSLERERKKITNTRRWDDFSKMITSIGLNCFGDDDQKSNDSNLMNKKIISKSSIINFPQNRGLLMIIFSLHINSWHICESYIKWPKCSMSPSKRCDKLTNQIEMLLFSTQSRPLSIVIEKYYFFVNKICLNVCLLQWAIADMLSYERWRSGYEDDFEMFLHWWWRSVPRRRQWFHYLLYSCVRFFPKASTSLFFTRKKFYKNHFLTD